MPEADLILTGAAEIATPVGQPPFRGAGQGAVETLEDGAVAFRDGRIVAVAPSQRLEGWEARETVACEGCTIVPGFVDAHTHLVWAGHRADELVMKLEGASYQEILAAGGGIHSTVRATRQATQDEIVDSGRARLDACLALGTTTMEAKTGYALTRDGELGLLGALERLDEHPVDLVHTVLGAHALPEAADREAFVAMVCDELTPEAAGRGLARFTDAFVDEGAFTVEEGRRILEAGRKAGLERRLHADELARTGAYEIGLELDALSIDHLNRITDDDVARLGQAAADEWRGVATLCPVTPFTSDLPYAPAHALIEAGVPVALGSDLNPNAWTEGMVFTLFLAVHGMRMTPSQALVAATANSAWSLGLEDRGRLTEGLVGDAVVLDVPSHTWLGYRFGADPVRYVIKDGQRVV